MKTDKDGNPIEGTQEENSNGGVILNPDQLADITAGVTAALMDAQQTKEKDIADATNKKVENASADDANKPFNMDQMAEKVVALVKEAGAEEQNKVFDTLWQDKFNNTMTEVPGFEDYLNGEDDYARVRMDQLNSIPVYNDKLKALGQLKKSYKQALAGTSGRKPIVNAKVEKQIETSQAAYKEVNDKWMTGGYDNVSSFADDFFKALGDETAAVQ